jgi:hypothetical protein
MSRWDGHGGGLMEAALGAPSATLYFLSLSLSLSWLALEE